MLLVDDEQPKPRHGCEERAARADDDIVAAGSDTAPDIVPFAAAQFGVDHRDAVREAPGKARHRLRRQRDLRHQHDRLATPCQRFGDGAQVDLGLPTAGDAMQQKSARGFLGKPGAIHALPHGCLFGSECRRLRSEIGAARERVAFEDLLAQHHQAGLLQFAQHGRVGDRRSSIEFVFPKRTVGGRQHIDHRHIFVGAAQGQQGIARGGFVEQQAYLAILDRYDSAPGQRLNRALRAEIARRHDIVDGRGLATLL